MMKLVVSIKVYLAIQSCVFHNLFLSTYFYSNTSYIVEILLRYFLVTNCVVFDYKILFPMVLGTEVRSAYKDEKRSMISFSSCYKAFTHVVLLLGPLFGSPHCSHEHAMYIRYMICLPQANHESIYIHRVWSSLLSLDIIYLYLS